MYLDRWTHLQICTSNDVRNVTSNCTYILMLLTTYTQAQQLTVNILEPHTYSFPALMQNQNVTDVTTLPIQTHTQFQCY